MRKIFSSLVFSVIMLFVFSQQAFASDFTSESQAVSQENASVQPTGINSSIVVPLAINPGVSAGLSIYASSDAGGSSIPSASGHAFVTISNYKTTSISVGKLSGISQYKTVSVGTWGNKTEHTGLWYNLEALFTSQGSYPNRVSLSMDLTDAQLATVNALIVNGDSWSTSNNCSSFAEKIWNSVSSTQLSNGTFNTPTALRDSIKSKSGYKTGLAFSYNYLAYYANGTGTPLRSTQY